MCDEFVQGAIKSDEGKGKGEKLKTNKQKKKALDFKVL